MTDNYKTDQDRFFEELELTAQERERRATARDKRRAAELAVERDRRLRAERAHERATWLAANPNKTLTDHVKLKVADLMAKAKLNRT